jgi:hypothetical protein
MLIWWGLAGVALVCAVAAAARLPFLAVAVWIGVVESTPELWRSGTHETLIGVEKAAGVALVLLLGLRVGWRRDRYNPGFAFIAMFATGVLHGLYPGLTLLSSLRSLAGSAGPFAFSFVATGAAFRRLVTRMAVCALYDGWRGLAAGRGWAAGVFGRFCADCDLCRVAGDDSLRGRDR